MKEKKIEKQKDSERGLQPGYGLPLDVRFCKKCLTMNTRPSSMNEYKHTRDTKHTFIEFDAEGICSACRFNEKRDDGTIDWKAREQELIVLLDKYRSKDGSYDILVPGSGGKDSAFASHVLKYKYGMHPLTVTWSPHMYTEIGWKNFENWLHVGGFDNYLFTPNGKIHRMLTRNAFLNLLHPFQPFILGQKTFPIKMAVQFGIPLIFYGENPGEYGSKVSINQNKFTYSDTAEGKKENEGYRLDYGDSVTDPKEIYLGGKSVAEYLKEGVSMGDLSPYLPLDSGIIKKNNIEFHYLGYYLKWVPQECYYYAVKHTGFEANPERTEGTYAKYASLDDRIDGFFYYTTFIKYGYGRATRDASQEIRNHHIDRDEGIALVKRFDGEFPKKYYKEFLDYVSLSEEEFLKTIDSFRDPLIWKKEGNEWKLKHILS